MNAPSDDAVVALFRAVCPGDKCFSPNCVTSNPNCRTEHSFVSRLAAAGYTIIKADELERLRSALTGLLAEWDKFTRYGSPMAKSANEPVAAARAALNPSGEPS